tara:strand:+ start:634 stop:1080 length:447 start_codon:yes stop_codon:yes gene_type:complete
MVSNIKAGIEARIEASLPEYKKLSYQLDIPKNKFKGNAKRYAVEPLSGNETESTLGAITLDQTFSITLTDSYNSGAKSQVNDEVKVDAILSLKDDIITLYKDISNNKKSIDNTVLLINDLNISEAEFIEEEKLAYVTCSFTVKYKINI